MRKFLTTTAIAAVLAAVSGETCDPHDRCGAIDGAVAGISQ